MLYTWDQLSLGVCNRVAVLYLIREVKLHVIEAKKLSRRYCQIVRRNIAGPTIPTLFKVRQNIGSCLWLLY